MNLNSRCAGLLRELSAAGGSLPVEEMLLRAGISRRALHYDLGKINNWLAFQGLGAAILSGKTLSLTGGNACRDRLSALLDAQGSVSLSMEQRRALVLLLIATAPLALTVERLQEKLNVSKNTVLGDLRELKGVLSDCGLSLRHTVRDGYAFQGDEIALRRLLGRQIRILGGSPGDLSREVLHDALDVLCGNTGVDYFSLVREGVRDYERALGTCLVADAAGWEPLMTLLSVIRGMLGHRCEIGEEEKRSLQDSEQFKAVGLITRRLVEAGAALEQEEIYYLCILYLGVKNYDPEPHAAEIDFIGDFTTQLMRNFERAACVRFPEPERLRKRLYLHIWPMYYRVKYGVRAENALTHEVRLMYDWVYSYTRLALKKTGGEIEALITEEEIAYLCVYMGGNLQRWDHRQLAEKRKILILCGTGVAASVLLREQMAEMFGNTFHYILVPASRLGEEQLDSYCLVISTVACVPEAGHIVRTGPVLSEENKSRIIDYVMRLDDFFFLRQEAEQNLEIMRRHASVSDPRALFRELFCAGVRRAYSDTAKTTPQLPELLHRDIILQSTADTAAQAMDELGVSLAGTRADGERLAREMLGHIYSKPDFADPFEISEGILLEHCRGDEIDARIMLLPDAPKLFGEKPVYAIIAVSVVDNMSHLPLIADLYGVFAVPDAMAWIAALPRGNAGAARSALLDRLAWA